MNVDVMVNGRPWKVAVEPAEKAGSPTRQPRWGANAGTFTITIKGKSRVVDASWIDADTMSLVDAGAAREIRLHQRADRGAVGVEFGGKVYEAVIAPPQARLKSSPTGTHATGATGATGAIGAIGAIGALGALGALGAPGALGALGAVSIKAPMPGRVVRVLVAVGDHVTARQAVVVVEAMKMENELRTPRDGTVKEIAVVPGAAVETGAVLVVIGD
jgi:biotin carboxyl carrier protein